MRILLLTQWFDPEPTFKGLLFAKQLQAMGHQVQVLTGFPNYPGGKVYPGYRIRWFQREIVEGVEVLRAPLFPSHDQSGFKRALNYLSFWLSSTLVGMLIARKADVIYAYHPPLTTGVAAACIGAARGTPFVVDIQDLWPDTLSATGMLSHPRLLHLIERLCQWVYRQAAHVTVLSPGFKTRLEERGVLPEKITVVPNWADEAQIRLEHRPEDAQNFGMTGRFNVVFAGTMGKAQALEAVLEAARLLPSDSSVQFVLVGGGIDVENLEAKRYALGLTNVRFLPRMPPSEIGRVLGLADALLVHLKDDPLFAITIPSKTQAYLHAGKPVIMAVRGDAATLVEDACAGVTVSPENPEALAAAVQELTRTPQSQLEDMGARGQAYYRQYLSLEVGARRFAEMFERVQSFGRDDVLKRAFDVVVSSMALAILALPMLVIAVLVRWKLGAPILFSQIRPGLHGQPFQMYKFRTMTDARDEQGELLSDAERLTRFGLFLRSTSLDELPELWNVLRGQMSLVGPRPLLIKYLERYTPEQAQRHAIKPGLTGWAQINGRNAISWEEKFSLDIWYIDHQSFWLDIKILWLTLKKIVKRDGISAKGEATMTEFIGTYQDKS
jgi:lipopolysaccharide/colanic/teichoic acid biosynthesis glycosyltransferase